MTKVRFTYNHDMDAACSCGSDPSMVATLGTLALGAGVYFLGKKLQIATKLANDAANPEKINDPDTKSRLMQSVLVSKMEMLRESISTVVNFEEVDCEDQIKQWAHRNRHSEFAYNKKSTDVYELIMIITGYMVMMIHMEGNIPDYLDPKKNRYFSPLTLAADLISWYIMEATVSDASPFISYDDELKDADEKYLERAKQELKGFIDALQDNCNNTRDDGRSGVITYLEGNDFVNVTPLHKMKKALAIHQAEDFLHIAEEEDKHTLGDIPWGLLESFRKRMKENLTEPCLLAKKYARRKEILKTAEDIKELAQILKEAGKVVIS